MENQVVIQAKFNPLIRTYILTIGSLILLCTFFGIILIPVWLLIGRRFAQRYFESLECELSTRSLNFSKGILFRVQKTVPLENIQDLTFIEGPLLRKFNLTTLKIETAGSSNPNGSDMKLLGIIDAEKFREAVLSQREQLADRANVSSSGAGNSDEVLNDIKEILLRIEKRIGS